MTFLAKLGKYLAMGLQIALGVSPLVTQYLGAKASTVVSSVVNDLTQVGQVVVQAEALLQGTGTGASKLAAATPLVAQIIKTSELVSGHNIKNEALFTQGCTKITSGVADILNALDSGNVKASGGDVTVTQADITAATSVTVPTPAPASAPPTDISTKNPLALS